MTATTSTLSAPALVVLEGYSYLVRHCAAGTLFTAVGEVLPTDDSHKSGRLRRRVVQLMHTIALAHAPATRSLPRLTTEQCMNVAGPDTVIYHTGDEYDELLLTVHNEIDGSCAMLSSTEGVDELACYATAELAAALLRLATRTYYVYETLEQARTQQHRGDFTVRAVAAEGGYVLSIAPEDY